MAAEGRAARTMTNSSAHREIVVIGPNSAHPFSPSAGSGGGHTQSMCQRYSAVNVGCSPTAPPARCGDSAIRVLMQGREAARRMPGGK
jgi:hypothetical protein